MSFQAKSYSNTYAAILVISFIVLAFIFASMNRPKDTFVSGRAEDISIKAGKLFSEKGDNVTYTDYKMSVGGSNVVEFTDIKNLWKRNRLDPSSVQAVIS